MSSREQDPLRESESAVIIDEIASVRSAPLAFPQERKVSRMESLPDQPSTAALHHYTSQKGQGSASSSPSKKSSVISNISPQDYPMEPIVVDSEEPLACSSEDTVAPVCCPEQENLDEIIITSKLEDLC